LIGRQRIERHDGVFAPPLKYSSDNVARIRLELRRELEQHLVLSEGA
jgi:hypothetical protein